MPAYLTEDDVHNLLTMTTALEALDEAFRQQGAGLATNEPRRRVRTPQGQTLHVMFAAQPGAGVLGLKSYTTGFAGGPQFHVMLYSAETGGLLAIIEANRLGQLRTGAASGIATRYMARQNAKVVACIGTGWQARTQVEAVCRVRTVEEVRVYSRDAERRRQFSNEMSGQLGVWVVPADSAEAAVRGADVAITMTSSAQPVLRGEWLEPGMHLNITGSNSLLKREIDDEVVRRAHRVVVDSRDAVPLESGDLLSPLQKGILVPERLRELAEVVVGDAPGRASDEEITLFKSHGLALEDIAVAARVYRAAVDQGLIAPDA